jgi:putative membrane-bound dehydrogenase-like protein
VGGVSDAETNVARFKLQQLLAKIVHFFGVGDASHSWKLIYLLTVCHGFREAVLELTMPRSRTLFAQKALGFQSFAGVLLAFVCCVDQVAAAPPRSLDDRLTIELVATEPEIVTPTGIAVDGKGRIYCIESHTHFRPEGYTGPPADRIRVFDDFDATGRARKVTTFFEGTKATMGLAFNADQSWLYVVSRSEMFRIRDTNGDGVSDEREALVRLETTGEYPHNGLNGCAFDDEGRVYFGQGENLGVPWKLVGADGASISGGDGGRVYRCNADGTGLEQFAEGCWNPFGQCFDLYGNLFVVDNDPDNRPPCRLLYVVPGADFGYRFSNGRKGLHPFSAWNGDLPGTLPMVAGTGEAPSAVLVYQQKNLPIDYFGKLLVTSWGDHRIESYALEPVGAGFRAQFKPVIVGDEDFRPVGMAVAPDGSLVISDWVDKSYELHSKGRIWRVRAKEPPEEPKVRIEYGEDLAIPQRLRKFATNTEMEVFLALAAKEDEPFTRAEALRQLKLTEVTQPAIWPGLTSADPFVAQAARRPVARAMREGWKPDSWIVDDVGLRLAYLLSAREARIAPDDDTFRAWLADSDESIRMTATRWVGENRLERFRAEVTASLALQGQSPRAFATALAALERFDGVERKVSDEDAGETYVAKLLADPALEMEVLERAVAMLRPENKALNSDVLNRLWESGRPSARKTVLAIWSDRNREDDQARLAQIAADDSAASAERAMAIAAVRPGDEKAVALLMGFVEGDDEVLAAEALRSLRGAELSDAQRDAVKGATERMPALAELAGMLLAPPSVDADVVTESTDVWLDRLQGVADVEAGERVFFHPRGPGCFKCHQVSGRGAAVGPDLTTTARQLDRRRLIDSILRPSAEVAPQFTTWTIVTVDGRSRQGMLVAEAVDGTQTYLQADGTTFDVAQAEIAERAPATVSVMPERLEALMTEQEFRDLVGYLSGE